MHIPSRVGARMILDELEKLANLDWEPTNKGKTYMPVEPETVLKLISVVRAAREAQMYGKGKEDFDKAFKALEQE